MGKLIFDIFIFALGLLGIFFNPLLGYLAIGLLLFKELVVFFISAGEDGGFLGAFIGRAVVGILLPLTFGFGLGLFVFNFSTINSLFLCTGGSLAIGILSTIFSE